MSGPTPRASASTARASASAETRRGARPPRAPAQAAARIGGPRLALQLLICPILDYSRSTASRREFASGYLLDQATLDDDLLRYAPGVDPANPRISPLRAG